ncbi:MAG: hypothetical protein U0401_28720 [Anaerolineae bacterium]
MLIAIFITALTANLSCHLGYLATGFCSVRFRWGWSARRAVGVAELFGSGSSSLFIDRMGKRRGTALGLLLAAVGVMCCRLTVSLCPGRYHAGCDWPQF